MLRTHCLAMQGSALLKIMDGAQRATRRCQAAGAKIQLLKGNWCCKLPEQRKCDQSSCHGNVHSLQFTSNSTSVSATLVHYNYANYL